MRLARALPCEEFYTSHKEQRYTEESRNRDETDGKNRRYSFLGHLIRKQDLVIAGEIVDERDRGRTRLNFIR